MPAALGRTFESLQVRNYRLFFSGQVVSWTGTWVQWVAQGWLVLELTGSGLGLGVVTAMQWLPILVFGAWAGVVADRFDKRKLLLATNAAAAALSLLLGIITMADAVTLWIVIVIALVLGLVTAIDNPTRQTFTLEMVGRHRLTNAVSLNTATFTTARVVGPAVAALLIEGVGIGECFLVNAASFVPITLALLAMRPEELDRNEDTVEQTRGMVREGLRYVASKPVLRTLMTMMAVIGTLEYNFQVILPVLAKQTFLGDAGTFGLLGSFLGIGMFLGSMANATFGRPARNVLLVAGASMGVLTLLLALSPEVWVAAALMVPLGASSMAFLATMNSSLQLESSDAMRGRVMALYFVLFLGSTPVGAPIMGWITEAIDPRAALALGATATLAGCLYGWLRLPAYSFDRSGEATEIAPQRPRSTASWRT
jgi:MFS family permease